MFKHKLWLIAGFTGTISSFSDVWSSSDVAFWESTPYDVNTRFHGRSNHTSVVFDNKIWIIGCHNFFGNSNINRRNDILNSTDVATSIQANNKIAFSGKSGHTSIVFHKKIWVICGKDGSYKMMFGLVVMVSLGSSKTPNAPFFVRSYHTTVALDNKIWIIGGSSGVSSRLNDVYIIN